MGPEGHAGLDLVVRKVMLTSCKEVCRNNTSYSFAVSKYS